VSASVSICVVNWNGRDLLRALLDSIRTTCGGLPVEMIVVDNASGDGSADMVAAEFPEVKLVRNADNRGFARGNNQAAAAATGKYLFFLNNDTVLREGSISRLVDFLDQNLQYVAVGPKLIGDDGQPQHTARNLPTMGSLLHRISFLHWTRLFKGAYRRYRRSDFDPEQPGPAEQLAAAALLVRRESYDAAGGWDEGFPFGVEDVDLCRRLRASGEIYYLPDAVLDHLGRVSSRANRPFVYRSYEIGYARYVRKHFGGAWGVFYKFLVTLDMPLRVIGLAAQWLTYRLAGRHDKLPRTGQLLNAASRFLATGLPALWRA
jgi:N-acetylglucosaminyl-diphospho-decaprenol L-rhamnosyltransferase